MYLNLRDMEVWHLELCVAYEEARRELFLKGQEKEGDHSYCGRWAFWHPDKGFSRYFCGRPTCDRGICGKMFVWNRRRLLSDLVEENRLFRFASLTMDHKLSEDESWEAIHPMWAKFRHIMKRRQDGIQKTENRLALSMGRQSVVTDKFLFVAVLEAHEAPPYPHLHLFTNVWMEELEWGSIWTERCGGGKVPWIETVQGNPEYYVTKHLNVAKYVGKSMADGYVRSRNHRTIWRTKGMRAKFELTSEEGWSIIKDIVYDEDGNLDTRRFGDGKIKMDSTHTAVLGAGNEESKGILQGQEKGESAQGGEAS